MIMSFEDKKWVFLIPLTIFLIFVANELYPSVLRLLGQIPQDQGEFYGSSTFDFCTTGYDCIVSGCNEEICQGKEKKLIFSICIMPSKPTPQQAGYECGCVANKCQWAK